MVKEASLYLYILEQLGRGACQMVCGLRSLLCTHNTAGRFRRRYIQKAGYVDIVVGNHECRIHRLRKSYSPTVAICEHTTTGLKSLRHSHLYADLVTDGDVLDIVAKSHDYANPLVATFG